MIKTIEQIFHEEDSKLNPFAVTHKESNSRVHLEDSHSYRLPLQRDRDRIYHSRYFKRLQYKTQVFTNTEGDNFRTRLTHTLEVSAIARSISVTLGFNSYLTETIALAHDMGHAPFGHAGQDILSELMKSYGGFEHNKQSLRILQNLENRYPNFDGLNLTKATLKGIMKHGGDYKKTELNEERNLEGPSIESLIADYSDEIAYTCHDIEDGLEMNFLNFEILDQSKLWKKNYFNTIEKNKNSNKDILIRITIRNILDELVTDLTKSIAESFEKIKSKEDVKKIWQSGNKPISHFSETKENILELKSILFHSLYKHPKVLEMSNRGISRIEKLFKYYSENFEKIPDDFKNKLHEEKFRIISDYISGMTDRYAIQISDSI